MPGRGFGFVHLCGGPYSRAMRARSSSVIHRVSPPPIGTATFGMIASSGGTRGKASGGRSPRNVEAIENTGLLLRCRVGGLVVGVPLLRILPGTTVHRGGDRGVLHHPGRSRREP